MCRPCLPCLPRQDDASAACSASVRAAAFQPDSCRRVALRSGAGQSSLTAMASSGASVM